MCAVIDAELLGAAEGMGTLRDAARVLSVQPLDLALFGGEDYALLIAARPGSVVPDAARIGHFEELAAERSSVLLKSAAGSRAPLRADGFDHFRE
ncbi:MAG: hypothetical protein R3F14_04490 [Polyangiaceae bacterium]